MHNRRNLIRGNLRIWEDDSYLLRPPSIQTTHVPSESSQRLHRTISMDTAGEDFASDKQLHGVGSEDGDYSNLPMSPTSTLYPPSPTAHSFKFRKEYASGVTMATMVDLGNTEYAGYKPTSPKSSLFPPPSMEGNRQQ